VDPSPNFRRKYLEQSRGKLLKIEAERTVEERMRRTRRRGAKIWESICQQKWLAL
jgi:hypothetical protein